MMIHNRTIVLFSGTLLFLISCAKEEPDVAEKFKGNWTITEISKDYGKSSYTLTIADSSQAPYSLLSFLYSFRKKAYGIVNGSTLTIPSQIIEGNEVSGTATLQNTSYMTMNYFVKSTKKHTDTVTAELRK